MNPSEPKTKSRVSYGKELRDAAKKAQAGLVTVNVTFPNGEVLEHQAVADLSECRFVKWATVLLGRPETRPFPDLEEVVREVIEKAG